MNGDNFDDTSKPTSPRQSCDPEDFTSIDPTAMMDPQQKRLYMNTINSGQTNSPMPTTELTVTVPGGSVVTPLYLCPKCQKKSHYDPKEFHGLCPACWSGMPIENRAKLTGEFYSYCPGECDWFTTERDDWKDTHGYCHSCWLKLTTEQRAILKGEEPPPPQETRIVHLPAVPSLWKVFGVSILATALAIAACSVAGYFLVFHLHR